MEKPPANIRKPESESLTPYQADGGQFVAHETNARMPSGGGHDLRQSHREMDGLAGQLVRPTTAKGALAPRGSAAKRKLPATFRRLWEVKQSQGLQQLQQVQQQVQQINQILAERKQTGGQSRQVALSGDMGLHSSRELRGSPSGQRAMSSPEESVVISSPSDSDEFLLEEIARLNQLLVKLQADIDEGEQALVAIEKGRFDPSQLPPNLLNSLAQTPISPPHDKRVKVFPAPVDNPPVALNQPVTSEQWHQSEQDALRTAAALRYLSSTTRNSTNLPYPLAESIPQESPTHGSATDRKTPSTPAQQNSLPFWNLSVRLGSARSRGHPSCGWLDHLGQAVLWVVASATVRLVFKVLLANLPWLNAVITPLLVAPALLAIALVLFQPTAPPSLIYKLFLVSIGLLLGGKL